MAAQSDQRSQTVTVRGTHVSQQTGRQESTSTTWGIVPNSQVKMTVLLLLALKINSRVCLCQISLMVAV